MTTEQDPAAQAGGGDWDVGSSPRRLYAGVGAFVALIAAVVYFALVAPPDESGGGNDVERDKTAQFEALDGSVKVLPLGIFVWGDAASQDPLHDQDRVRTGVRSTAEISFLDDTLVNLRPESLITIQKDARTRQRRAAWFVSSGEVNFDRQRSEGTTSVSTPSLTSEISERASANVRVDASGESDLRLFRGQGRVETTSGETVELSENEGVRVGADGQAGPKLQLPAAPTLAAPADAAQVPEAVPPRDPNRLSWQRVPNAASYRVVVSTEASFADEVVDRGGVTGTALELPRLSQGSYHWRVAAIGPGGGEGEPSAARSFTIVSAPGGPELSFDLQVRGNIVHVSGKSAPGASVTINGYEVPTQGDGSFDEYVNMSGGGAQDLVVRAVARNGGVSQLVRRVTPGR
jgi:hypothetical protein